MSEWQGQHVGLLASQAVPPWRKGFQKRTALATSASTIRYPGKCQFLSQPKYQIQEMMVQIFMKNLFSGNKLNCRAGASEFETKSKNVFLFLASLLQPWSYGITSEWAGEATEGTFEGVEQPGAAKWVRIFKSYMERLLFLCNSKDCAWYLCVLWIIQLADELGKYLSLIF